MQKIWHYIDPKEDTCLSYESWNKKTENIILFDPQLGMCALGDSKFVSFCVSL